MSPFYTNKIASNQFGQFGFDIKPIKISEKGTKHNNVENKIIAIEMVSSDKKLPRLFLSFVPLSLEHSSRVNKHLQHND